MIEILKRKTLISAGALIFLCFFWTGSAYISWLYKLTEVFGTEGADFLSEGIGYIFQVFGVLAFSLAVKKRPSFAISKITFAALCAADGIFILGALISSGKAAILIFGFAMNLLHGAVAGYYLLILTKFIPQQRKGIVFGISYALGSIFTWIISLPLGKTFLNTRYVLVVYFLLIATTIAFNCTMRREKGQDEISQSENFRCPSIVLIGIVIVLLSAVKGLGFFFPTSESIGGIISLEFSRVFYSVGLIAAGYIGDKNRKYGAVCCLAALVFPFISLACVNIPDASVLLWILGYVFFGFFSVYRVVVFSDIAAKKQNLLWLSGLGLMFGRLGDAAGALGGMSLKSNLPLLITISSLLFVATIILFFAYYGKLYSPVLSEKEHSEALFNAYEARYEFTSRQSEIFRLIVRGCSNAEISSELFLSESTVKFHIKNILKKTENTNRTELVAHFKSGR